MADVTHRGSKHTEPMEGDDSTRRVDHHVVHGGVLPPQHSLGGVCGPARECLGHLRVTAEAQHDVVDLVLEHKVVVIVGGGQLYVLDDKFVQHDVNSDHSLLEFIIVTVVLLRYLTTEDLGPDTASETVRTSSLEIFLGQRSMVHVQHLDPQLVPLLLQGQAGVISAGSPGTDPKMWVCTT